MALGPQKHWHVKTSADLRVVEDDRTNLSVTRDAVES